MKLSDKLQFVVYSLVADIGNRRQTEVCRTSANLPTLKTGDKLKFVGHPPICRHWQQYKYHVERYGHPSKFGFKDVIQTWKGEKFDPDYLLS